MGLWVSNWRERLLGLWSAYSSGRRRGRIALARMWMSPFEEPAPEARLKCCDGGCQRGQAICYRIVPPTKLPASIPQWQLNFQARLAACVVVVVVVAIASLGPLPLTAQGPIVAATAAAMGGPTPCTVIGCGSASDDARATLGGRSVVAACYGAGGGTTLRLVRGLKGGEKGPNSKHQISSLHSKSSHEDHGADQNDKEHYHHHHHQNEATARSGSEQSERVTLNVDTIPMEIGAGRVSKCQANKRSPSSSQLKTNAPNNTNDKLTSASAEETTKIYGKATFVKASQQTALNRSLVQQIGVLARQASLSGEEPVTGKSIASRVASSIADRRESKSQGQGFSETKEDDEFVEFLAQFYAHKEVLRIEAEKLVARVELMRLIALHLQQEGKDRSPTAQESTASAGKEIQGNTTTASNNNQEPDLKALKTLNRYIEELLTLVRLYPLSIARQVVRQRVFKMLKADHEGLMNWLRQRQKGFPTLTNTTFELLEEFPNRSINICKDGPKILILPDGKDILHCLTRDQWIGKLWSDLRLSAFHYPIIVLNILIFLFGTTGNIFVCLSVYRNHQLRSVTNYFIVNLAFADFLVIFICLPATGVWDLTLTWFFGTIPCKLIMFLQDVSISVSVLTLTAISLDRYYAICHPLKFKSNLSQAKRMIVLIWIVSLIIMVPDLIYLSAKESQELSEAGLDTVLYSDCNYDWSAHSSKMFQFIKTILLYLVPLMLMFCTHYTIMQTLKVASTSCHNELQSMKQIASLEPRRNIRDRWTRPQSQSQRITSVGCGTTLWPGKQRHFSQVNGPHRHHHKPCEGNYNGAHSAYKQDDLGGATSNANAQMVTNGNANGSSVGGQMDESPSLPATPDPKSVARENPRQIQLSSEPSSVWSKIENGNGPPNIKPTRKLNQRLIDLMAKYSLDSTTSQAAVCPNSAAQTPICHILAGPPTEPGQDHLIGEAAAAAAANQTDEPAMGQLLLTMHNRTCIESRQKAASMLAAIVAIFAICYLPVHLINFLRQFIEDIPQTDVTSTISMLAHCACYLNSAINPIIYNHMNSVFRAEFRKFLSCLCWHRKSKMIYRGSGFNSQGRNCSNMRQNSNGATGSGKTNDYDDDDKNFQITTNDAHRVRRANNAVPGEGVEIMPISGQSSIESDRLVNNLELDEGGQTSVIEVIKL